MKTIWASLDMSEVRFYCDYSKVFSMLFDICVSG